MLLLLKLGTDVLGEAAAPHRLSAWEPHASLSPAIPHESFDDGAPHELLLDWDGDEEEEGAPHGSLDLEEDDGEPHGSLNKEEDDGEPHGLLLGDGGAAPHGLLLGEEGAAPQGSDEEAGDPQGFEEAGEPY